MLKELIESLESLSITHGDTTNKFSSYDAAVIAKVVSEASDEQRDMIAKLAFKSHNHFKSLVEAAENQDSVEVETDKEDEDKSEVEVMKDKVAAMKEEIAILEKSIKKDPEAPEGLDKHDDASAAFTPDAEKETLKKISEEDCDCEKVHPDMKHDDYAAKDEKPMTEEPGSTRGNNTPVPMNPNRPGKVVTPVSKRDDGMTPVKPTSSRGDNSFVNKIKPGMGEEISPAMKRANMRSTSAQNDPKSIVHAPKPAIKPTPKVVKEDDAVGVGVKGDNDDQLDSHGLSTIDLAQRSGEVEKDTTVKAKAEGDKTQPNAGKKDLDAMVKAVSDALKGSSNPFKSGPFGRGR